jgi:heterodisulfide reductase subunit A-like polyferredoxin
MNDWLLPMQQWNDGLAPDLWGRFYDPLHPDYGPPHASSTGIYLEGLADALALAQDCGDGARAAAYRRAIWRGLRSLRQLQFVDDVDMFYVSKRRKVTGALRTEAYDNEVRIDNLAHALLALLKLARMPDFTGGEHHE